MKTLILLTSDFPYGSGEVFVANEFPFLAEKFERVFIITTSLHPETVRPVPAHVKVIHIPYDASLKNKALAIASLWKKEIWEEIDFIRNRKNLPFSRRVLSIMMGCYAKALEMNDLLEKLAQEYSLDLKELYLYSYWMNNLTLGLSMFKDRHFCVKAFCRTHGWDLYFERHTPSYLPFRNYIISRLDACFCISSNGMQYINQITSYRYPSKIQLSRLGSFNGSSLRNPMSLGKLRVVSCSSIIPLKRVHLIIEALALLGETEATWTHFGDGPLMKDMRALAERKLSGLKNIEFQLVGKINNADLMNYYATTNTDLFLNVSETEGLPVSIMEANSYGIPVIATNVGGVSEIVRDGYNGIVLNSNATSFEIAAALKRFATMTADEKSRLRKNAFEVWDEGFNAEKNYNDFVQRVLAL